MPVPGISLAFDYGRVMCDQETTYTVVSGHLGSPAVNNGIVTHEQDGAVTGLEAGLGSVLDGCGVGQLQDRMMRRKRKGDVGTKTYKGRWPFGPRQ